MLQQAQSAGGPAGFGGPGGEGGFPGFGNPANVPQFPGRRLQRHPGRLRPTQQEEEVVRIGPRQNLQYLPKTDIFVMHSFTFRSW